MIAVKRIVVLTSALLFAGNLLFSAIASSDRLPSPPGRGAGGEGGSAGGSPSEPHDKKMFLDGVSHDFGKVKSGLELQHTFRIVNTSNIPLHIGRIGCSSNRIRVRANKETLQPGEEGKIELVLYTNRFRGATFTSMFVTLDNGKRWEQRFWVTAVCVDADD